MTDKPTAIEEACAAPAATELADVISERFRHLCETSGFAETFDARTGVGLRDRATPGPPAPTSSSHARR